MPAHRTRLSRAGRLGILAAAGIAILVVALTWAPRGPGGVGSPRPDRTAVVAPSGTTGAPDSTAVPRRGGEGFAWSYDLPDDPDLQRQVILGFEIWTAGQDDTMRGVFAGALDLGSEPVSLPVAAEKLRAELGMIPGAPAATAPEPVVLTAGDALQMRLQLGKVSFVGYAVVADGIAYRLIVAGYPDDVAQAVAMSLRFE
jgi:hypothetical protein